MDYKLGSVILIAVIISSTSGVPRCSCPHEYSPICGSDGKLYTNRCLLDCTKSLLRNDLTVTDGPCVVTPEPATARSPCTCARNLAPVCGSDGVTYNNICLLRCAREKNPNLEVQHQGSCDDLKRSKRGMPYERRYSMHRRYPCSSE